MVYVCDCVFFLSHSTGKRQSIFTALKKYPALVNGLLCELGPCKKEVQPNLLFAPFLFLKKHSSTSHGCTSYPQNEHLCHVNWSFRCMPATHFRTLGKRRLLLFEPSFCLPFFFLNLLFAGAYCESKIETVITAFFTYPSFWGLPKSVKTHVFFLQLQVNKKSKTFISAYPMVSKLK